MANKSLKLLIPGLDRLSLMELRPQPKDADAAAFEEATAEATFEPIAKGAQGEPVTTLVIFFGLPALSILAAWLMKDRETIDIDQTVTVRHPDGTITEVATKIKASSSKSKAEVIEALQKTFADHGFPTDGTLTGG